MDFENLSEELLHGLSLSVIDDTRFLVQPAVGMKLRSPYDVIQICEIGPTVQGRGEHEGKFDRLVSFRVIEVLSPEDSSLTRDDEPAVEAVQQELPFSPEIVSPSPEKENSSEKFRKLLREAAKIRESSYQPDHARSGKYEISIAEAVMIADSRLQVGKDWRNLAVILLTADWNSAMEW